MGSGRRADSGWLSGVGSIRALHGVLARGSQRLFSVLVSARGLARTFARCVAVISRIVHGKSSALRSLAKIPRNGEISLRYFSFQGATMPAAHMLAMTWFKSNHRSWYFSCYAGRLAIAPRSERIAVSWKWHLAEFVLETRIRVTFSDSRQSTNPNSHARSCQRGLLPHRMAGHCGGADVRPRFPVLRSGSPGTLLVLRLRPVRQGYAKVLSARHQRKLSRNSRISSGL